MMLFALALALTDAQAFAEADVACRREAPVHLPRTFRFTRMARGRVLPGTITIVGDLPGRRATLSCQYDVENREVMAYGA